MKKIILDTSFIVTCVNQKIDFKEELLLMGVKILIPKQVIVELEGLVKSNSDAEVALKIIKKNKFSLVDLHTKNVDEGIIKYAKENPEDLIATLDRDIIKKTDNLRVFLRQKKKLKIK